MPAQGSLMARCDQCEEWLQIVEWGEVPPYIDPNRLWLQFFETLESLGWRLEPTKFEPMRFVCQKCVIERLLREITGAE